MTDSSQTDRPSRGATRIAGGMTEKFDADRYDGRSLNELAQARGQSLAQMALAWILRLPTLTSALTGVSQVEQLDQSVAALRNLEFSADEIERIDALTL